MKLNNLNGSPELQFLIKELKNLILIPENVVSERTLENVEDKYFKSQDLLAWLKDHGISVTRIPDSRRGSQAVVYFLGDKVLKISDNQIEAKIASAMKGDEVVAVIDVIDLGDGNYGILQDAVKIDSRSTHGVTKALDCIMAYFDNHGKESLFDDDMAKGVVSEFGGDCTLEDVKTGIEMLKDVYEKTGHIHDDAAPSNIGLRDGEVVFTDLGPNVTA